MNKRIRNYILALAADGVLFASAALPAYALTIPGLTDPFEGITICTIFGTVGNWFFGIIAGISLILVIIGGISYATSGGDKMAVAQARSKITAAITGLIIGLAAFFILNIIESLLGITIPDCAEPGAMLMWPLG